MLLTAASCGFRLRSFEKIVCGHVYDGGWWQASQWT